MTRRPVRSRLLRFLAQRSIRFYLSPTMAATVIAAAFVPLGTSSLGDEGPDHPSDVDAHIPGTARRDARSGLCHPGHGSRGARQVQGPRRGRVCGADVGCRR